MVKDIIQSTRQTRSETAASETKRRRKLSSQTPTAGTAAKGPKSVVYAEVLKYENEEAQQRASQDDLTLFQDICQEIRRSMKEVLLLKQKKAEKAAAEIAEKRVETSLLFVTMKKLNRLEKIRLKQARDQTADAKQKVDNFHLQLQNLLYEVMHLQKEVCKCQDFKSRDEDIPLVPVEDFYEKAPEKISRPSVTKTDPHQLKLARLEWELEQRKEFACKCKKLEEAKETVAKDIREKLQYLDNLAPRLKTILEATEPMQEYLQMPLNHVRAQHEAARYLPKLLYTLYVQGTAYQEACDPQLAVNIVGDIEEAKICRNITANLEEADDDSDSDQETEVEETSKRQKHRRHHEAQRDRVEEKKKELIAKHPLSLEFLVKLNDATSVTLEFYYLMNLRIVTVKCRMDITQDNAGNLLSSESVLSCLFDNDTGEESPNPANKFQMNQVGISKFQDLPDVGVPYVWAQQIAGMDFLKKEQSLSESDSELSVVQMERTIKAIRRRIDSRKSLAKQIQSLEHCTLPHIPSSVSQLFPSKIVSRLVSWRSITWETYRCSSTVHFAADEGLVDAADSFYEAVAERGSAKLTALVAIKPNYSDVAPIFSVKLVWNDERNGSNDEALREMEREVNVYCKEFEGVNHNMLSCQMHRLLACLDILVEAEGAGEGTEKPAEFLKEKIFFKAVKGRNRSRPFKYLPSGGGIFTQR